MELKGSENPRPKAKASKKRKVLTSSSKTNDEPTVVEPTRKRPVRKTVGKLADLPSMPLDILFEVICYLAPYDLLKLSWTAKDFRRLLLNKSALFVWKASLENFAGLPPCPQGMSEPAWVNLAFSRLCHFCLKKIRTVEWELQVRVCKTCSEDCLGDLRDEYVIRRYKHQPRTAGDSLQSLSNKFPEYIPNRPGIRQSRIYLRSDLEEFKLQYCALRNEEDRKAFLDTRRDMVRGRFKHAQSCEQWLRSQVRSRGNELEDLKRERKAAIKQKLKELGWGPDIASIRRPDSLDAHKLVNKAQYLTDKVWANIKDDILNFMGEMRIKRIQREFDFLVVHRKLAALEVLRSFKNAHIVEGELMPEGPDFCGFGPIKDILNQPTEVEVNVASFSGISLPPLLAEWREKLHEAVLQVVKNGELKSIQPLSESYFNRRLERDPDLPLLSDEEADEKLRLATSVFVCLSCTSFPRVNGEDRYSSPRSKPLFYPEVLGHTCFTRKSNIISSNHDHPASKDHSTKLSHAFWVGRSSWDCGRPSMDNEAGIVAGGLIKLAGLDSSRATPVEMDQQDLRFACLTCGASERTEARPWPLTIVPLLHWRAAVKHHIDAHRLKVPEIGTDSYLVLKAQDIADDIKEAEVAHRENHDCIWLCLYCRDTPDETRPLSMSKLKEHMGRHDVTFPTENEDYCKHFAASDIQAKMKPFLVGLGGGELSLVESSGILTCYHEDDDSDSDA